MQAIKLHQWRFHYNDNPDAWFRGFDDDTWEEVTVPHDWSVHMPFSKEYSSGTGYLAGGIGWYRTSFLLPKEWEGKRIYITFDGVYKNSQVWCNSYYMGKRPLGYATFRYDITDQVHFGSQTNLIAVKVDHRDISDSRWFTGSGITRKVTVTAEAPVHPEFNGIYFKTPSVTNEQAEIEIDHSLQNDSTYDVTVKIINQLFYDGNKTLEIESTGFLAAGNITNLKAKGILAQPKLWAPEQPNMYQLTTTISAEIADDALPTTGMKNTHFLCRMETNQTVGIRSIYFDPDKGFFLNEQPYKLKGVCVHHDAGCLGAAVLPEVWHRRLNTLKDMGCNAIRMSHNPHMPELYDLCDALGFFVMDEAFDEWEGPKNKWSTGHNVYPPKHQGYFEDFPTWHEQDLADFIKRDRNHPSIIAWSIGNEIDYPNDPYCHPFFQNMEGNNDKNKPITEQQYSPDRPNATRLTVLADRLVKIVKKHETTRPVTSAVSFPELSREIGFYKSLDIVGYNYKEQYYSEDHLLFPNKPFLGSENSHSYKAWKAVRDQEYISGQFLWTGIDYLGEAHGWPIHGSGAGILTLAGFSKTSFYRRKSFWSSSPMLYLTTARAELTSHDNSDRDGNKEWKRMYRSWNYPTGEMLEVRCYTNLPVAELFCNGRSLGTKEYNNELGYIDWFVPFERGELTVMGIHNDNKEELIRDELVTTGRSCNIELNRWMPQEALIYSPTFEDSLIQIEVTITDSDGRWVTNDSSLLYVNVAGAGRLVGLENGDLADNTEYSASYRRAYEGRLVIYIAPTESDKDITVTVQGEGLKPAIYHT
jgi:hypothetical protein